MKSIARFVTRKNDNGVTDLAIMLLFKNQNVLKPDTVYQIDEVMGEMTIREVGAKNNQINWNKDIATIVDQEGVYLIVTADEFSKMLQPVS